MKILHIYKYAAPESVGGVERVIQSISRELIQMGISSDVLATSSSQKSTIVDGSHIHYYPITMNTFSCPISLRFLNNFHKIADQYDLLHYHFPWPFADLTHMLSRIRKPTVMTYHLDIVRQPQWMRALYSPLMHHFLNQMDHIVATSQNLIDSSPVLQRYKHKTSAIPITIDPALYPKPDVSLIQSLQQTVGSKFFLFIGVLRYYKGLDFLLEAVRDSDIPVVIAGSGPEELKLKTMVLQHNMTNVTFLGYVTEAEKVALLSLCQAVVAPAHLRSEAFCISLLEGLMFGKPLISTDLGTGTSFVNKHNVSGLVVKPGNSNDLRVAMQQFMQDDLFYQQVAIGAKQHFNEHFGQKKMAESYLAIYKSRLHTR